MHIVGLAREASPQRPAMNVQSFMASNRSGGHCLCVTEGRSIGRNKEGASPKIGWNAAISAIAKPVRQVVGLVCSTSYTWGEYWREKTHTLATTRYEATAYTPRERLHIRGYKSPVSWLVADPTEPDGLHKGGSRLPRSILASLHDRNIHALMDQRSIFRVSFFISRCCEWMVESVYAASPCITRVMTGPLQ